MNWFEKAARGNVQGNRPIKEDVRTPLYMLYGIDCSGSMSESTKILNEIGGETLVPKIDQANKGVEMAVQSMMKFQRENTRFRIQWQVVELNTYCKPVFETYVSLDDHTLEETKFKAEGSTNIEALFNTYASFITQKHLGRYNRAVNIILMSDGIPTDVNGYELSESKWKEVVDRFKLYLDKNDFSRNVEFYFIAVGEEAEAFGKYFAGDHYFRVEESESLSYKIDFVTRQSLADSTTIPRNAVGYTDLMEKDDEDEEDDGEIDEEGENDETDDGDEENENEDSADEDLFDSITDDPTDDDNPGAGESDLFDSLDESPKDEQEEGENENETEDQTKNDSEDGGDLDDLIRF